MNSHLDINVDPSGVNNTHSDMDQETFTRMWEMSAPGSPAERCFLRIDQTEYYVEESMGDQRPITMPGVNVP